MKAPQIELSPYQAEGVRHLLRQPHGGLLMDPGTRKTSTTLSAFYALKKRKMIDRMVVLGPLNAVTETWPAEINKWKFPFSYRVLHGSSKDREAESDRLEPVDILCVNYDGMEWFFNTYGKNLTARDRNWWLIADESTKLKHTNTARFKTLRPWLQLFARRTVLSGDPQPNGYEDLFGQVLVCDLGSRLGRYITQYRREFFFPSGYGGYDWTLQPDAEKRIWERLDGLFYRVSDDVLGLKPLEHAPKYVNLRDQARKTYDTLEREFVVDLGKRRSEVKAVNAGVLTQKLRQCANGFLYDGKGKAHHVHDEKLKALNDLVEEMSGKNLLVGFEFHEDAARICEWFGCPSVSGRVAPKERKRLFSDFNAGRLPILAAQMGATALSVNLQEACNHVAMYGQIWDYEIYNQFYKRVRRSGQKHTVFLHEIIAKATVDVDIHRDVVGGKGSKKERSKRFLKAIEDRYNA